MKKTSFMLGLFLASAFLGAAFLSTAKVLAVTVDNYKDCNDNAVIYCGFTSPSNFITKVKADSDNHGHHDLQALYAGTIGMEPKSYDQFAAYARSGLAIKSSDDVVVDGQVVMKNVRSLGRQHFNSGDKAVTVNGTTYYWGNITQRFGANVQAIPVSVLFNSKGVAQFAVLQSCGNPVEGNNIVPQYSCKALRKTAVSGKLNTYQFTTDAPVSNNATVAKVVYDFGDGASATETTPSAPVTHTYTEAGTFTAKVTVYVHLPGNQQVTAVSATCQTKIQVVAAYYQCVELTGAILDKEKFKYSFTADAKFGNGATLTSADFNFGDGVSQQGVKPASGASAVTVTHQYATAGDYNTTAVLHFNVNGKAVTAATCAAGVTPTTPPTPECKPGVPVGSPMCSPCPSDSSVPTDSPQCKPLPTTLPYTGAGDVVAIFAGVVVAGFLVYRQLVFRRHKAAFLAAERGTSLLPLDDPLNEAGQPATVHLASRRRGLRRRRPY